MRLNKLEGDNGGVCVVSHLFFFKWVTSPGTSQEMVFVLQSGPFGQLYLFKWFN